MTDTAALLTPEQIAALEALEKAVPKCPWECGRREAHDSPAMVYCDDATGQRIADCTGQYLFFSQAQKEANAAFIAALRNAAPALIAAARREAELRAKLGPLATASSVSGMSWGGFNIIGDRTSIDEVSRVVHRSSQLDEYQKAFDARLSSAQARIAELVADLATAEARISELEAEARNEDGDSYRDMWKRSRAAMARACARANKYRAILEKAKEFVEEEKERRSYVVTEFSPDPYTDAPDELLRAIDAALVPPPVEMGLEERAARLAKLQQENGNG